MAIQLRCILIIVSFFTMIFVMRKIRKSQMKIEDSIWWIIMSIMILVLSIFPQIGIFAAGICGIESPVNLIYLVIIFLLLIIIFSLSIKVSKLNYKVLTLVEELAIRDQMKEEEHG